MFRSKSDENIVTQRDLDAYPLIKGRPVILQSRDGHAIWVSRATLDANAPFPDSVEGGVILRDESGEMTGSLIFVFVYVHTWRGVYQVYSWTTLKNLSNTRFSLTTTFIAASKPQSTIASNTVSRPCTTQDSNLIP